MNFIVQAFPITIKVSISRCPDCILERPSDRTRTHIFSHTYFLENNVSKTKCIRVSQSDLGSYNYCGLQIKI